MPQILGVRKCFLGKLAYLNRQPELLGIMSFSLPQALYLPNKSFI